MIPQLMIYAGFILAGVSALCAVVDVFRFFKVETYFEQQRCWQNFKDNFMNAVMAFAGTVGFIVILDVLRCG